MGRRLGRYELLRVLGEGGAGVVHEAVLHGPGGLARPVALKVLRHGGDGLRHEARLGGLLRHRNLVDVYEVGRVDDRWFCALELCRDGALAGRKLPPRAVVEVGLQVCAALDYAHRELGLVHLDLKPGNLLLSDGVVKVADLGIARAAGFQTAGRIRGTLGYMAPEQAHGGPVDARSDVYALGVTLVELALGRLPRGSGTFELDAPLPDPPDATGDVPAWLLPLYERCTDPDPEHRPAGMAELAQALRTLPVDGPGLREALGLEAPPAAANRTTNLAAERGPLLGRDAALADLARALASPGVVALRGPAGIGKSRLAREAARAWHARTGGEAWRCDLSEARSRADVLLVVARVLDVPFGASAEGALAALGHALAGRGPVLVVLDDAEVVAEVAPVVRRWAATAPDARFVITARRAIDGIACVEVAPLALPDGLALLCARARERGAEVADDPAAVSLVRRLDGIPLALELAAGRLGVLSPAEVELRLDARLLRSGEEHRHGTLEAALDGSLASLAPSDLSAFARLSVFVGGFTIEAAEAVLGGSALEPVERLLADALLVADGERFRMLEPVRACAGARLDDRVSVEARHGAWCATLREDDPVPALEPEHDNLVLAARRALERGDAAVATRCASVVAVICRRRGPLLDGAALAREVRVRWPSLDLALHEGTLLCAAGRDGEAIVLLSGVLADPRVVGDGAFASRVRVTLAKSHRNLGRPREAREHAAAALALARGAADRRHEARALSVLSAVDDDAGELEASGAAAREALALYRALGDRPGQAACLGQLASLLPAATPPQDVDAAYRAAIAMHRDAGDRGMEGAVLAQLGVALLDRAALPEAHAVLTEAVGICRSVGRRMYEARALCNLGLIPLWWGDLPAAHACFERARTLFRELGNPRGGDRASNHLASVELELGNRDVARALYAEALELARATGSPAREAVVLSNRAEVTALDGDPEGARAQYEEALALGRRGGNRGIVVHCLSELAWCEITRGALALARQRLDEAESLARAADVPMDMVTVLVRRVALERAGGAGDEAEAALVELRGFAGRIGIRPGSRLGRLIGEAEALLR